MLSESQLYPYQRKIAQFIQDHPFAMIWADMGLGKTVSTLTAVVDLMDRLEVPGVLIIAPVRVIQGVWRQEAKKWEHTQHLRFSLIHGSKTQRRAALKRRADIYLVNYENLEWLSTEINHLFLRHKRYPPFQMVVYDEVTKMKNPTAVRSKAWKKMLPYLTRRVGLTGEPASNGYKDLFGQYLQVDGGERLGTSVTSFRERYLRPMGYGGYNWIATKSGQQEIHQRIEDITIEMAADDYLDLPPVTENIIWVDLPPKAREVYDTLEKEFFAELANGVELEVANEASKLNKLIQLAGGAAYFDDAHNWSEVHREKISALQDALDEAAGRPLLLGYTYRHEAARIAAEWPERPDKHDGASFLSSSLGEAQFQEVLRRWKSDEIPLLCGHPASMGHGVDGLQDSSARAIVWFSLPWSLELYKQMSARLFGGHRRKGSAVIHHILARDTMDEAVWAALKSKSTTQAGLRAAIGQYQERRGL